MTAEEKTLLEAPKALVDPKQDGAKQQTQGQVETQKLEEKQQQSKGPKKPFAVVWQTITKIVVAICAACQIGNFVCALLNLSGSTLQKAVFWYIQVINVIYLCILFISMVTPVTNKFKVKHATLIFNSPFVIMLILAYISLYNMNGASKLDFKGDTTEVVSDILFSVSLLQVPIIIIHIIVSFCNKSGIQNWYVLQQKQISKPTFL